MVKEDKERKDIVSGQVMDSKDLLRFTVTPDNQVIPDFRSGCPERDLCGLFFIGFESCNCQKFVCQGS